MGESAVMNGTIGDHIGMWTPAGVPAVYTPRLAGHTPTMGQWEELVSDLPDLIKSGGDVAANIYRAVNYSPAVYPTTYQSPTMTSGGAIAGIGGGTLLLVGAGLLAFMLLRK